MTLNLGIVELYAEDMQITCMCNT